MKKLLGILGTIALCGITSMNVVACGGGEAPNPLAQKIDLSDLPDKVKVTTTIATVDVYKNALIEVLKQKKEFNNLSKADVNITKEDGKTALNNKDIQTGDLKIRVTTINQSKFTGFQIITVTLVTTSKVDLSGLPKEVDVTIKFTTDDAYKTALIKVLKKDEFYNLVKGDVDITDEYGNALPTTITTNTLVTKVTTINQSKFTGFQIIKVNIAAATQIIDLGAVSKVKSLAFNDQDELYAGAGDTWVYKIDRSSSPTTVTSVISLKADVESLVFNNDELYAGTDNGLIYKIDPSSKKEEKVINFGTGVSIESLAFNSKNELYAGTSDNNIYKIDLSTARATAASVIDLGAVSKVESLAFNDQDELYAGAGDTWVYKIDRSSSPATTEDVTSLRADVNSLAFNNKNELYAGISDHWIYKIDLISHTSKAIVDLGADVESLVFNNDELYAGTSDNKIYKIKI